MGEDAIDGFCFHPLWVQLESEVESDDFRGVRKFKIFPLVSAHPSLMLIVGFWRRYSAPECTFPPVGHWLVLLLFFIFLRLATPALGLGLLLARGNVRRLMYRHIGILGIAVIRRTSLRVHVFIEFVYWLNLVFGSAPDPFGCRGEMALSPPRCARLFFLHSETGQNAPASVCPTGACSSLLYSAKCLFFLTGIVTGAAGHNLGARTQGGNFDGARHRLLLVVACLSSSPG